MPLLPSDAVRAELVRLTVPQQAIAQFVPSLGGGSLDSGNGRVRLASTPAPQLVTQITHLEGEEVNHFGDLLPILDALPQKDHNVQVDFEQSYGAESEISAAEIDSSTLASIVHTLTPESSVVRYVEGNQTWLLYREDGNRCKLSVRLSPESGLVQIVMGLKKCWGTEALMPREIRVSNDGKALRCLTVSETLEWIYGERESLDAPNESSFSFASVSERDDYLIPSNYERLLEKSGEDSDSAYGYPALMPDSSEPYPGPAILGDARALSGLLLQSKHIKAGTPEQIGWLVFAADDLGDADSIDIEIDMESGPRSCRYRLPKN